MNNNKGISKIFVVTIIFIVLVFVTVMYLLSLGTSIYSDTKIKNNCSKLNIDDPSCIDGLLSY